MAPAAEALAADRGLPALVPATPAEATAILGAMPAVAPSGGRRLLTAARLALAAAAHHALHVPPALDVDALGPAPPEHLAAALGTAGLSGHAVRLLAGMALVALDAGHAAGDGPPEGGS